MLLLILYGAYLIISPFITAITWAVILAILVYPLYAWLLKHLRGRATLAAVIVILSITLLIIAPGFEAAWYLSDEAVELVQTVRVLLSEERLKEWAQKPWVQQLQGWWSMVSFRLIDFKIDWKGGLVQGAQASSAFLVGQVKASPRTFYCSRCFSCCVTARARALGSRFPRIRQRR